MTTASSKLVALAFALAAAGACSEHRPGTYEGGGRSNGPIIIGSAGTNCTPVGQQCVSSQDCCTHSCEFNGAQLICMEPTDGGGPSCGANGTSCTFSSDCCSGFCGGTICSTPIPDSGGGGG